MSIITLPNNLLCLPSIHDLATGKTCLCCTFWNSPQPHWHLFTKQYYQMLVSYLLYYEKFRSLLPTQKRREEEKRMHMKRIKCNQRCGPLFLNVILSTGLVLLNDISWILFFYAGKEAGSYDIPDFCYYPRFHMKPLVVLALENRSWHWFLSLLGCWYSFFLPWSYQICP